MTRKPPTQMALFATTADGVTLPVGVESVLESEVRSLRHRVEVLEAWVRMVEGHVTGPMSALPTLDEAELKASASRTR